MQHISSQKLTQDIRLEPAPRQSSAPMQSEQFSRELDRQNDQQLAAEQAAKLAAQRRRDEENRRADERADRRSERASEPSEGRRASKSEDKVVTDETEVDGESAATEESWYELISQARSSGSKSTDVTDDGSDKVLTDEDVAAMLAGETGELNLGKLSLDDIDVEALLADLDLPADASLQEITAALSEKLAALMADLQAALPEQSGEALEATEALLEQLESLQALLTSLSESDELNGDNDPSLAELMASLEKAFAALDSQRQAAEQPPLTDSEKLNLMQMLSVQLHAHGKDGEKVNNEAQAIARSREQLSELVFTNRNEQSVKPQTATAVEALAQATAELREQLKSAQQADSDVEQASEQRLLRGFNEALMAQQATTQAADTNRPVSLASNLGQNITNVQREAVTPAAQNQTQETQLSRQQEVRQAQQAIDILAPQAPQALRDRVVMMFNARTQAAEVRLDPPDLGRMTIKVNLNQDQAMVNFQVANPQARDALEQALPKLRELLEQQGLNLTDASVSDESAQGQQGEGAQGREQMTGQAGTQQGQVESDGAAETVTLETDLSVGQNNGIDYYA